MSRLYVAVRTGFVDLANDVRVKVVKGVTIAREGHEILDVAGHFFERMHVHFDVTPPPPPAPKKAAAPKPATPAPAPEPEKS